MSEPATKTDRTALCDAFISLPAFCHRPVRGRPGQDTHGSLGYPLETAARPAGSEPVDPSLSASAAATAARRRAARSREATGLPRRSYSERKYGLRRRVTRYAIAKSTIHQCLMKQGYSRFASALPSAEEALPSFVC